MFVHDYAWSKLPDKPHLRKVSTIISNCLLTIAYRMTFDLVSSSAAVQNCLKIGSFFVLKHRALKTLLRYQRIGKLQYKGYLLTLFQSKFVKFKARVLRVIVRQQYEITIRNLRYKAEVGKKTGIAAL